MSAEAEDRLKAREDFLRLMSHEIRTPLNGVLGMLGLLARTRLDGAQRAYLGAARESAEHLLTLVNDLLDFAKIEAGRLELERAPVDLEVLVQSVAELLSPRAHEKNIEIVWAIDPQVPTPLADEGRLRQILFNLAGNAVKFTETGGVLISVDRKKPRADDKVTLRFSVKDTGPGVPAAAKSKIFEEFGHADPSHASRYGGAGLGLAVVKRLAEAMDGRLGVESKPGEGATFWVEAEFEAADAPRADKSLAGLTVAVASPCALVRDAAARQIKACGGKAVVGATLDEALAAAPAGAPALIDHALAADGQPIARPRDRKCVILLRTEERGLIERYRGGDWSGYLIKPLRRVSLAARVLAALGRDPAAATGPQTPDDERVAPAAAAGARVLLVEDNPVNALLAQALLKREGCSVERASSGKEALEALARTAFDVVVMDVRMPGMDGMTATRELRRNGNQTPVIALTANAFEDDRKACLEAGMNAFLSKPIEPQALRTALARWTKRSGTVRLAS